MHLEGHSGNGTPHTRHALRRARNSRQMIKVTLSRGFLLVLRYLGCLGRFVLFTSALFLGLIFVGFAFPFLLIIAVVGFLLGIAG